MNKWLLTLIHHGATSVVKGAGPGEGLFTGILTIPDLTESGCSTHAQPCLGAQGDAYCIQTVPTGDRAHVYPSGCSHSPPDQHPLNKLPIVLPSHVALKSPRLPQRWTPHRQAAIPHSY